MDENSKFEASYRRMTGEEYGGFPMEEEKKEEKPHFIKAMSVWMYWKIANVIYVTVRAIMKLRKK